jgi:actin-related protein
MVFNSIMKCDVDIRKKLYKNLVMVGVSKSKSAQKG